jgi:hypothetical protein
MVNHRWRNGFRMLRDYRFLRPLNIIWGLCWIVFLSNEAFDYNRLKPEYWNRRNLLICGEISLVSGKNCTYRI